jgi:glycosyltransferase involved in cell wall biosynthesis
MIEQAGSQRESTEPFNPCVVIPFYNHPSTIGVVLNSLRSLELTCFVVDDASDQISRDTIAQLALQEATWIRLLRHEVNQGKGGAVMTGCNAAYAAGHSHALQIDADGQHNPNDVPKLLQLAREHIDSVISGVPVYDESIPKARLYGRYMTHIWVWINTLSLQIRDSMCGLRVYPLSAVVPLWTSTRLGRRMDFDVEVLVRLSWRGVRVVGLPTKVTYPADGISHFDAWRDNVAISGMHARLFFGMLMRLPLLLGSRLKALFSSRN